MTESHSKPDFTISPALTGGGWRRWIVSGGGLGLLKPAPGSWGTIAPATVYWLLLWAALVDPWRSLLCLAGAILASVLIIRLAPWACAYFKDEDPPAVVLDEFCGYWIACLWLPTPVAATGNIWRSWLMAAGVYILFRLADTLKLPPCRKLEKLPAGWGILFDDVAAGIQVNLALQVLLRLVHL